MADDSNKHKRIREAEQEFEQEQKQKKDKQEFHEEEWRGDEFEDADDFFDENEYDDAYYYDEDEFFYEDEYDEYDEEQFIYEYDDEFDEAFSDDEGEDDGEPAAPSPYRKWIIRAVVFLIVAGLLGNVAALYPQLLNTQALKILQMSRQLSKDEAVQAFKRAIVVVQSGNRKGTGFNIAEDGVIVTNQHVIDGARQVEVGFPDGQQYVADVIAADAMLDLAVLRVRNPRASLPMLQIQTDPMIPVDEEIYYIGNPMLFHRIVGKGTVLGLTRAADGEHPIMVVHADIFRGNSGSPVITMDGEVIGVIFAMAEILLDGERTKVGLAVPMSLFPEVMASANP